MHKKILLILITLSFSLTSFAGKYDWHRHYHINVPDETQILSAPSNYSLSITPHFCSNRICHLTLHSTSSGHHDHTVTIGRNWQNYCQVDIRECRHWLKCRPEFLKEPRCSGSFHMNSSYIEHIGRYQYGFTIIERT